jgi:RNA polymerase sigma-70 factor (ECF subfamily)
MNYEEISDAVIRKAASNDMGAFEIIYNAFSSFVYNVGLRMTGKNEEAEEITQDVFMKVHKKISTFQFQSAFKTWVYRIAVNTTLNRLKGLNKASSRRADLGDVLENLPGNENTLKNLEQKDTEMELNQFLNQLNEDQKTCIVLRELEGLEYNEIAELLDIPVNTVRSRLNRGRSALINMVPKGEN